MGEAFPRKPDWDGVLRRECLAPTKRSDDFVQFVARATFAQYGRRTRRPYKAYTPGAGLPVENPAHKIALAAGKLLGVHGIFAGELHLGQFE